MHQTVQGGSVETSFKVRMTIEALGIAADM